MLFFDYSLFNYFEIIFKLQVKPAKYCTSTLIFNINASGKQTEVNNCEPQPIRSR